jgi:hypothetical protein
MELSEAIVVTRQRRDWLTARIAAKRTVGWEVDWDERERDAHNAVLVALTGST